MTVNVSRTDDAVPPPPVQTDRSSRTAESLTCLFTGGGTGGHVYPALAIADAVRCQNPDARIIYVGTRGKIEETLVPQRGYTIRLIRASGLPARKSLHALFMFALQTGIGFLQSLYLLLRIRPDIVIATGGYVSAPVMLALGFLKTLRLSTARSFIHEQNVMPGIVNRLAGRIVDRIGVSFKPSLQYFPADKVTYVGYPVRPEIASVERSEARKELGIPSDAQVVFAFGGSQGSRAINRGLIDALPALMTNERLHVIHVIGRKQDKEYHAARDTAARLALVGLDPGRLPRYRQFDYAHNIQVLYAASDLVIGRGGAATITEICACSRPAIIIPISNTPGDHQAMNAHMLKNAEAGYVLYEEAVLDNRRIIHAVNGRRLADMILGLLDIPERLTDMSENAHRIFDSNSITRIIDQLDQLKQTGDGDVEHNLQPATAMDTEFDSLVAQDIPKLLSPFRLLRLVQQNPDHKRLKQLGPEYIKYRIDCFLTDPHWETRNVGVKLIGLLKYEEKLPLLLHLLTDRSPAPRLHRLFGGDYEQVGFIRRNVVFSITQLDRYGADIRTALLTALTDPYYEVRSAAAQAFTSLASYVGPDREVMGCLRSLLRDSSFEVITAAVSALGKVGNGDTLMDLQPFYLHSNWKVREAVIRALIDLLERDKIADVKRLQKELDNMLVTCVDFQPAFPIKQALNDLSRLLKQQQ